MAGLCNRRRRSLILKIVFGIPITWFTLLGMSVMFTGAGQPGQDNHANLYDKLSAGDPQPQPPQLKPDALRLEETMKQDAAQSLRVQEQRRRDEGLKFRPQPLHKSSTPGPGGGLLDKLGFNNKLKEPSKSKPNINTNPDAPGELGKAVTVDKDKLSPDERKKFDEGWKNNAFNEYISKQISLHRSLPDVRDPACKQEAYPSVLPDTSVIICFHNEAWTTLLRTVHSVLDRSPEHLIKEIILVDDFSDQDHLKTPLDEYAGALGKVKVLHAKKREGLIRARLMGAASATGKVLTYLDSHCECTEGWLEPMLARISEDWSNVVTPVIDVIDDTTFRYQYSSAKSTSIGGFDWNLQFNWHAIPDRMKATRTKNIAPVASPTMAGGLFAIDKAYFEHLGTYDNGMDIWGGENLELSFKTWMCGGSLEIIPCSHVGHIFRKRSPYSWKTGVNIVKKNSIRLAEVWLDDYKKYYYERFNFDLGSYGDVSSRKQLRENLQCKSFQWFVDTIYPELFIPGTAVASGEIRNKLKPQCLDSPVDHHSMNKAIKMWPCHRQGGNQFWMLSKDGEIRRDEGCMDYAGQFVMTYPCHAMKGNQEWVYGTDNSLRHRNTNLCIEMNADGKDLAMKPCTGVDAQIWTWERKDTANQNIHRPNR